MGGTTEQGSGCTEGVPSTPKSLSGPDGEIGVVPNLGLGEKTVVPAPIVEDGDCKKINNKDSLATAKTTACCEGLPKVRDSMLKKNFFTGSPVATRVNVSDCYPTRDVQNKNTSMEGQDGMEDSPLQSITNTEEVTTPVQTGPQTSELDRLRAGYVSGELLCAVCEECFQTKLDLRNHFYKCHKKIWPHVCKCGQSYKIYGWYKKHLAWHERMTAIVARKGGRKSGADGASTSRTLNPKGPDGNQAVDSSSVVCHRKSESDDPRSQEPERFVPPEPELFCNKCMAVFGDKPSLAHHVFNAHIRRKLSWCHQCKKDFPLRERRQHMAGHAVEVDEYCCRKCNELFDHADRLKDHFRKRHGATEPVVCETCHGGYGDAAKMKMHRCTWEMKGMRCSKCGKVMMTVEWFQAHVLMCQMNLSNYECPKCGKRVMTKTKLQLHSLSHTKDKTFSCPKCRLSFKYCCNLRRHERQQHSVENHSGRKYKCQSCHKGFFTGQDLTQHEAVHTNLLKFECHICGAKFAYRSNLGRHKREAHEGKPSSKYKSKRLLECKQCQKVFRNKNELQQHQGLHMKVWPYKCYVCHEPFRFRSSCSDHFHRYHRGVPWQAKLALTKQL